MRDQPEYLRAEPDKHAVRSSAIDLKSRVATKPPPFPGPPVPKRSLPLPPSPPLCLNAQGQAPIILADVRVESDNPNSRRFLSQMGDRYAGLLISATLHLVLAIGLWMLSGQADLGDNAELRIEVVLDAQEPLPEIVEVKIPDVSFDEDELLAINANLLEGAGLERSVRSKL